MKLIENSVVILEKDTKACIQFFDNQKDADGLPLFFDVRFIICVNGKRRASCLSFAGIIEEAASICRRFPVAHTLEIRMVRMQQDDPAQHGAIMLPEFSSLTFRDNKTALLDGAEWHMR